MSWDDFLEKVAETHSVFDGDERQAFMTKFADRNLKSKVSNAKLANDLNVSAATLERRLGVLYGKFSQSCPKLDSGKKGKFEVLREWLKTGYAQYQETGKLPGLPATSSLAANNETEGLPVQQSPDKSQEVCRRMLLVKQIDLLNRESRVRCAGLWQVLKVNYKEADELANDQSLGNPPPNLQLDSGKLILLIGEMGAGKSLIAERLFQRAIQQLREDINAPIPIYIEAWQLQPSKPLYKFVEEAASSIGNSQTQGAVVMIDRTDEVERSLASWILREARSIVKVCHKTTIIITSRPIPDFAEAEESVIVPPLSNEQAYILINRLAGKTVTSIVQNSAKSVLNAINRPLFAVLAGIYLRNQNGKLPRSKEHLLSSLVEHSLRLVKLQEKRIVQLLQQLAIFSVDGGGAPVPANKVASWFERQELLNSVLVIEHSEHLRFSLPILTQWFAKESLAIGNPDPNELASEIERIERWRYPLILATATLDSEKVSRFLEVIAERYPAIAAEIVNEALVDGNITNETSLPQSLELGRQVRTAMQAWINGIASIAQLIAGVREDGTLPPIGVRVSKKRLDIDDLPIDFDI